MKKSSSKDSGKSMCCLTIFFFIALIIIFVIWAETPIGSVEERITEIVGAIFLYGFGICMLIIIANSINATINERTKRGKPGINLSVLNSEKKIFYFPYYLLIIGIIIIGFNVPANFYGLILLNGLLALLVVISFILIAIKFKRIKYWVDTRDLIAIFSLFLIIISIWGIDPLEFFVYLMGIVGIFTWVVWFIIDVIKGRIKPIKLLGLTGIILIVSGIISHFQFASYFTILIIHLGFYVWIGFFVSELLQRNKIQGLDEVNETKIFEDLIRDAKTLIDDGKKSFNNKDYSKAVDYWESSVKFYEKALKIAPSSTQKEKIQSNIVMLQENIGNALEMNANKHNKKAVKAHEKSDLVKASNEWSSAIEVFEKLIAITKSEKLNIDIESIKFKMKVISKNLEQLEIEKLCASADDIFETSQSMKEKDITNALQLTTESISLYSEALSKTKKNPDFKPLAEPIKTKIVNTRNFQEELERKMDQLIGITPLVTKVVIEDADDIEYKKVEARLRADKTSKALKIIREFEFIGGQVRFKIGLINHTNTPLTGIKLSFDFPDALKWVAHEPNKYERKGDSIRFSKLGKNEKKVVSLYLEPVNCMESPINATISFFDAEDRPQAIPMEPKMIDITCPIFFTKEEANLARVKQIQRSLTHQDKKIFPIVNLDKISLIFSTVLSVLGNYDIKLIFRELSEEDKFGEAWFYGTTKVKKNRIITYLLLEGESKTLEIEVSADDQGQITGFLAEIGNKIRDELLKLNIIESEEQFYDISMSMQLNHCPYCWNIIPSELIEEYLRGKPVQCEYCKETLIAKGN